MPTALLLSSPCGARLAAQPKAPRSALSKAMLAAPRRHCAGGCAGCPRCRALPRAAVVPSAAAAEPATATAEAAEQAAAPAAAAPVTKLSIEAAERSYLAHRASHVTQHFPTALGVDGEWPAACVRGAPFGATPREAALLLDCTMHGRRSLQFIDNKA